MISFKREIAPLLLIYISSGLFYFLICSLVRKAREKHIHRNSRKGRFLQRLLEFLYGAALIVGSVLYLPWATPHSRSSTFCQYAWVWDAPKHCMNSYGFAVYHFRVITVTLITHVVFALLLIFYLSVLVEAYKNRKRLRELREEKKAKKSRKRKKKKDSDKAKTVDNRKKKVPAKNPKRGPKQKNKAKFW